VVLKQGYPNVNFLGVLSGENLARHYAGADLFVFPFPDPFAGTRAKEFTTRRGLARTDCAVNDKGH
jgi:glycosyltransferase involved in cell wall biosynthesis